MGKSTDGRAITPYLHSWAYDQEKDKKANKYIAIYQGQKTNVCADSENEAQQLVADYFRCKHPHKIVLFTDRASAHSPF